MVSLVWQRVFRADFSTNPVMASRVFALLSLGVLTAGVSAVGFAAPGYADGSTISITPDNPYVETFGTGSARNILQADTIGEDGKPLTQPGDVYVSADGQTYTASNYWDNVSHCNGIVLSFNTQLTDADCSAYTYWSQEKPNEQANIQAKAAALGLFENGVCTSDWLKDAAAIDSKLAGASDNRALSTNTTAGNNRESVQGESWPISINPQVPDKSYDESDQVMIASQVPIKPQAGSAFLELSVDYAASACKTYEEIMDPNGPYKGRDPNPVLTFQWLKKPATDPTFDPATDIVQSSDGVDVCGVSGANISAQSLDVGSLPVCTVASHPRELREVGENYNVDGSCDYQIGENSFGPIDVHTAKVSSPIAQLFSGADLENGLYYRVLNVTNEQNGNDGALDNVTVTVASPSIEKSFQGPLVVGQASPVKFTIVNTPDLAEKKGWSLTDNLTPGLYLTDPLSFYSDCGDSAPAMQIVAGANSDGSQYFTIQNGYIGSGVAECHVWVNVVATEEGATLANCGGTGDNSNLTPGEGVELPDDPDCEPLTVQPMDPDNPLLPVDPIPIDPDNPLLPVDPIPVDPSNPLIPVNPIQIDPANPLLPVTPIPILPSNPLLPPECLPPMTPYNPLLPVDPIPVEPSNPLLPVDPIPVEPSNPLVPVTPIPVPPTIENPRVSFTPPAAVPPTTQRPPAQNLTQTGSPLLIVAECALALGASGGGLLIYRKRR